MKFTTFFFALSVAGAFADSTYQERTEEYEKICPEKHGKEEEISPGLTVRYMCDRVGYYRKPAIEGVDTPRECADECAATSDCKWSSWDRTDAKCFLSGQLQLHSRRGAIQMIIVENKSNPEPEPEPEPSCEDICDDCATKIKKCNCNDDKIKCGYTDGAQFTNNGKKYTAHCNKLDDYGGANLKYLIADSIEACVAACSEYPNNQCKRAIWNSSAASGGHTGCWLRGWSNVPCNPTTDSSAFSSAHVHDDKCPQ